MSTSHPQVDPETFAQPLKFAYWVPNVSGGLVVSKIEQRTNWSLGREVLPIVRELEAAELEGVA